MIITNVDKNLEKNIHHIFTYNEVRDKIVEIFGEPETDIEHRFIQQETMWAWKKLPCYKMPVTKHNLVHIQQGTNDRRIRSYKLVLAGLNSLIKEQKSKISEKK